MGIISLQIPVLNQPDTTEDPKVQNNFTTLQNVINGGLDTGNLSPTAAITVGQLAAGVVLALSSTGTNRKIAWGGPVNTSVGLDSTASRSSLNDQLSHGMGLTPVWGMVLAGGRVATQEGPTVVPAGAVTGLTATYVQFSFTINGTSNNGVAFYWVAIG